MFTYNCESDCKLHIVSFSSAYFLNFWISLSWSIKGLIALFKDKDYQNVHIQLSLDIQILKGLMLWIFHFHSMTQKSLKIILINANKPSRSYKRMNHLFCSNLPEILPCFKLGCVKPNQLFNFCSLCPI